MNDKRSPVVIEEKKSSKGKKAVAQQTRAFRNGGHRFIWISEKGDHSKVSPSITSELENEII
ncbi:MAG: hypothetical protein H3Z49_00825 [archaeon]|nr:hypothetical protein [archaeon]